MQEQKWVFIMTINQLVAKALKKEAKRKARIEERRAKRVAASKNKEPENKMHDIDKPITL